MEMIKKSVRIALKEDWNVESRIKKSSCPIENTRKMWKIDMPPFIVKLDNDAVVKLKICEPKVVENDLSYNISKSRRKSTNIKWVSLD